MIVRLTEAPAGVSLILEKVTLPRLVEQLAHLGLFEGSEFFRLDEKVLMPSVKCKTSQSEFVLCGEMAGRIVIHCQDGRKMPLLEMPLHEFGHIEGMTGGGRLARTLELLGLRREDEVCVVRRMPPMEYITIVEQKTRARLTEGMAAQIWGEIDGRDMQFVSARTGKLFRVKELFGGRHVREMFGGYDIHIGGVLLLERVSEAQSVILTRQHPLIISSHDGLRMFFHENQGKHIYVSVRDENRNAKS